MPFLEHKVILSFVLYISAEFNFDLTRQSKLYLNCFLIVIDFIINNKKDRIKNSGHRGFWLI